MKLSKSPRFARGLVFLIVATVAGAAWIATQSQQLPGGFEEWVGDSVSDLRRNFPSLVGPIASTQDWYHETSYAISLWWEGSANRDVAGTDDVGAPLPVAVAPPAADAPSGGPLGSAAVVLSQPADGASLKTAGLCESAGSVPEPAAKAAVVLPVSAQASGLTWVPYSAKAPTWLKVALIQANPDFPNKPATALWIDAKQAQLHWQPGTLSPWNTSPTLEHLKDAEPKPDRTGRLPANARGGAVLAFGGGFESIHFPGFGGIHDSTPVVALSKAVQTIAIYRDGSLRMAPWKSEGFREDGIVEARQNLPPLVRNGQVPANMRGLNRGTLGWVDDPVHPAYKDVHTWRSGLGITAEGNIIYVFGGNLTPRMLASALVTAGAVDGMQLDINAAYHCAPTLFLPAADGTLEVIALSRANNGGRRFLSGSRKDFFFVTALRHAGGAT